MVICRETSFEPAVINRQGCQRIWYEWWVGVKKKRWRAVGHTRESWVD